MTEILDDIQEKRNEKKRLSYLSFGFAVSSIIFICLIQIYAPDEIKGDESLDVLIIGVGMIFISIALCLLGLGFAINSFIKKEQNNFFKWFGLVANIIIALIFIIAVIFT